MNSSWVLFEAGALSKVVGDTHVCPLLIGLKPSDVKGPLSQFQFTTTSKPDMLQLVKTLNTAASEAGVPTTQLEKVFEALWPQLEEPLKKAPIEESKGPPQRSEREMLEEVLELVRNLNRPGASEITSMIAGLDWTADPDYYRAIDDSLRPLLRSKGYNLEDLQVRHSRGRVHVSASTKYGRFNLAFDRATPPDAVADVVASKFKDLPAVRKGSAEDEVKK